MSEYDAITEERRNVPAGSTAPADAGNGIADMRTDTEPDRDEFNPGTRYSDEWTETSEKPRSHRLAWAVIGSTFAWTLLVVVLNRVFTIPWYVYVVLTLIPLTVLGIAYAVYRSRKPF